MWVIMCGILNLAPVSSEIMRPIPLLLAVVIMIR